MVEFKIKTVKGGYEVAIEEERFTLDAWSAKALFHCLQRALLKEGL